MNKISDIKAVINSNRAVLEDNYNIKKLSVFGSFARGEQTKNSDIDMLVEFKSPVGFGFFRASRYLEEILGRKVDLVTKDALRPELKKNIVRELINV